MHTQCYAVYRRRGEVCPTCALQWDADPQALGVKMRKIGEAAFKDGQEKLSRRQRAGTSADGTQQGDDEEEEAQFEGGDDVEMDGPEQSQPASSQRGKGRATRNGRGKKKAVVEDDDDEMDVDDQQDEEEEEAPTRTQPKRKSRR